MERQLPKKTKWEAMRDATASWSGYLYQSIIGLIVVMENVLEYQSRNEHIIGDLVYEDFEDFSIYLRDQEQQTLSSKTFQVKFKKSTTPSDYYPFFRGLVKRQKANPTIEYFLNISSDVDFSEVNLERNNFPDNLQNIIHTYRNESAHLGGVESLNYLEQLVRDILGNLNICLSQSKLERIVSTLIAHIDKVIIKTKDMRNTVADYREIIQIQSLINIIQDTPDDLTEELASRVIRKRILNAFYIYSEPLEDENVVELEKFASYILSIEDDKLIEFTKKIEIHKDLSELVDLVSSFSNLEDIQDVLFEVIKSADVPLNRTEVVFNKNNCAYRPSTMRMSPNQGTAQQNLKMQYIPQIKRNMSLYDIEGYFQTKKVIISGNTIKNIWKYMITSSHSTKKENKINEPELKTLININEAIEELKDDE